MIKHLLLILIVLAGACADLGISLPKEPCKVQYNSNGVIFSQLKPDYSKTFVGGNVRYNIEVTNVGEKRADNIKVECKDKSELSCPDLIFNNDGKKPGFSLNPPDPTACIEGQAKQDQVAVTAKKKTGDEPAYFKLMLSYDYTSLSWSEVTLVSETQWKVRTQQGVKPVQKTYQSASPVKLELAVPDAPIVYNTFSGANNDFPITITLRNALSEYAYPRLSSGIFKDNRVDYVKLTAPEINGDFPILFVDTNCDEIKNSAKKNDKLTYLNSDVCTLKELKITTDEEKPESRLVTARITKQVGEEETYKITAEAKYNYVFKKASEQSVEITAGTAGG